MAINEKTLRVAVLLTLVVLSVGLLSGPTTEAFSQDEAVQTGPFVDSIWLRQVVGEDAVHALMSGEIDVMDSLVEPAFLAELKEAGNVDVGRILRNGYGCLSINTKKYPFNYTAFRRALAFALDKRAISDSLWAGMSEPLDSCVPKVNPFSAEGRLPYSYYDANVELGNDLLDDAGFIDIDNDTFREGPHLDDFDVFVWTDAYFADSVAEENSPSNHIGDLVGELCVQALQSVHVKATWGRGDLGPCLLCQGGDYDIVFHGVSFTDFDVEWLAYDSYWDSPWKDYAGLFMSQPNWSNASYDVWRNQLLHSTDYDDVYEAAIEMQKVWMFESPMIVCYENVLLTAHGTGRFENFIDDCVEGVGACWSAHKVRLKPSLGGPFGGTIKWGVSTPNIYNPIMAYLHHSHVLNNLPWDSLLLQGPDGRDVAWIADSFIMETHEDRESVLPNTTRITFRLAQNASWSDGRPLTAEDVTSSINYYREAVGNPFGLDLADLTAAYALDSDTFVVEFLSESYWHLHKVVYKPILPKEVLAELGPDGWQTWKPNPSEEPMLTSGAFSWSAIIYGNIREMKANPNYFHRPSRSLPGNGTTTNSDTDLDSLGLQPLTVVVMSGSLIVIVGVLVLWKRSGQQ